MKENRWDEGFGKFLIFCVSSTLLLATIRCEVTSWHAHFNDERRKDERLIIDKNYYEVVIPKLAKEKVPFIPQLMLRGEPTTTPLPR